MVNDRPNRGAVQSYPETSSAHPTRLEVIEQGLNGKYILSEGRETLTMTTPADGGRKNPPIWIFLASSHREMNNMWSKHRNMTWVVNIPKQSNIR